MLRRPSPLSLVCCVSTSLALAFLAAAPARAQDQRKNRLPSEGESGFMKSYGTVSSGPQSVFRSIKSPTEGEKASKDNAEHQKAIDMAAQYYTYRLTWDNKTEPGKVEEVMREFFGEVSAADGEPMRKGNPTFREMFLKALAQRARDVVQTEQPHAAVNAGRMLARLAQAGSGEAGDACLEAVKNTNGFLEPKARLGVQYWAFQGLGNLLGRWGEEPLPTEAAAATARKDREAKYVEALVGVIEQFIPRDGKLPAEVAWSNEDEKMGMRLYRREAVRALAQYRNPAVTDDKGAIKVKSALTLLKVTNNDGLSPPAGLDEQIDAAWGVARQRAKALPSYQPDYAAQQVGYVVVAMATAAKPRDLKKTPGFPWAYHGARLYDAVEVMRAEAKGAPDKAGDYVEKMAAKALTVLKEIELKQAAVGSELNSWLGNNAPPHDTLYKGVADSTVRPLNRPADAPEKPAGDKKPDDKKPDDKKPADKPGDKKPGDKPSKQ
jgi:hypothetical protein